MRWGARPAQHIGDTKIITKFLFLPKKLNYEWRWLEKAKIRQMFLFNSDLRDFKWKDMEWVD